MSKLTDIIRREVEGCVARQSGLIVTPATVTAVREDYLRADVKLLGNGSEVKGMLNKTAEKLTVGQTVTVWASRDVANKALLLGFGVPFLLLVCVLLIALRFTASEGVAALWALGSLVPYYFALWVLRARIQQGISFQIEE